MSLKLVYTIGRNDDPKSGKLAPWAVTMRLEAMGIEAALLRKSGAIEIGLRLFPDANAAFWAGQEITYWSPSRDGALAKRDEFQAQLGELPQLLQVLAEKLDLLCGEVEIGVATAQSQSAEPYDDR